MLEIDLEGERLLLLPERAIWWESVKTLIVSDLHWGKSAHFRKHGIAIPADTQDKDELRLAGLLRTYNAERLIIAGDMFHSKTNNQVEIFSLRIKSKGSNQPTIKLCCFAEGKDRMILPAFGHFTGTHEVEAKDYRHLYLIAENKVIKWK